jgi:hypothetical protein
MVYMSLLLASGCVLAQPTLRITSPPEGTLLHPGQSFVVTVEASPPEAFHGILILGGGGLVSRPLDRPPYRFDVEVPKHITPRRYPLRAFGATKPGTGEGKDSESVMVIVERSEPPVRLFVPQSGADLDLQPGEERTLHVEGEYDDDTSDVLAESMYLTVVSGNPEIAKVTRGTTVAAVAPGSTRITIFYRGFKAEVPVVVRKKEKP